MENNMNMDIEETNLEDSIEKNDTTTVDVDDAIMESEDIDYSKIESPLKNKPGIKKFTIVAVISFAVIIVLSLVGLGFSSVIERALFNTFGVTIDINRDDMDGQSWQEYFDYQEYLNGQSRLTTSQTKRRTVDDFRVSVRENNKIPDRVIGY